MERARLGGVRGVLVTADRVRPGDRVRLPGKGPWPKVVKTKKRNGYKPDETGNRNRVVILTNRVRNEKRVTVPYATPLRVIR